VFLRNGQALGSVLHSAAPKASATQPAPKKRDRPKKATVVEAVAYAGKVDVKREDIDLSQPTVFDVVVKDFSHPYAENKDTNDGDNEHP